MTGTVGTLKRRRVAATALVAGLIGGVGAAVASSPAATAETATSPDATVTMSVPPPVVAGVPSTYTLTFTNASTSATTNVVAVGSLPAGMTLRNIGNCARLGGNQSASFNCSMPNLTPGSSESATFTIVAGATGRYDIPFGVAAAIPDPNTPGASDIVGDQGTLTVNVQPGPTDIQVTGSSNNGSPPIGSNFAYTFQVKDNGPIPAGGVTFDDALPASIRLVGNPTIDVGACTANAVSNSVHCDIGDLGVGQQSTISFSATPMAGGVVANTSVVAMTGPDTHLTNNDETVVVQPK